MANEFSTSTPSSTPTSFTDPSCHTPADPGVLIGRKPGRRTTTRADTSGGALPVSGRLRTSRLEGSTDEYPSHRHQQAPQLAASARDVPPLDCVHGRRRQAVVPSDQDPRLADQRL